MFSSQFSGIIPVPNEIMGIMRTLSIFHILATSNFYLQVGVFTKFYLYCLLSIICVWNCNIYYDVWICLLKLFDHNIVFIHYFPSLWLSLVIIIRLAVSYKLSSKVELQVNDIISCAIMYSHFELTVDGAVMFYKIPFRYYLNIHVIVFFYNIF